MWMLLSGLRSWETFPSSSPPPRESTGGGSISSPPTSSLGTTCYPKQPSVSACSQISSNTLSSELAFFWFLLTFSCWFPSLALLLSGLGSAAPEGSQFLPQIPDKSPEHSLDAALTVTLQEAPAPSAAAPGSKPESQRGKWEMG